MSRFSTLLLCLSLSLTTVPARAASDAEAKPRLDHALERIESSAHTGRIVGGSLLIAIGAGLGVGSYFASQSNDPDVRGAGAVALGVLGGVSAVGGTLVLLLPTDAERLPQRYFALPDKSASQLHAKIGAGEDYLWQLNESAHRSRILAGILGVGIGAAEITLYATSSSHSDKSPLYTGIILGAAGIADFLVKTQAENEYDNYHAWKSHIAFNWGVTPLLGGGAISLGLRF